MKKYIHIMVTSLIITVVFFSCKKDNTPDLKNYSASIKDKTWWGTFAFTDKTTEYFSVNFKADSSLLWSDLSGNFDGKWSISGNKLKMTLTKYGAIISAEITNDNKLKNISNSSGYFEVYSCALVANPNIAIDNMVWKGIVSPDDSSPYSIQMSFIMGNKVDVKIGDSDTKPETYTRTASGAVIRIIADDNNFFCVIISDTEMKGSSESAEYPFQAMKQ